LLIDYISQLHSFYINVGKTLPISDTLEVTEAVAHVIAVIPVNELLKALQLFCMPLAQQLHDLASKGKDASEKDRRDAASNPTTRNSPMCYIHQRTLASVRFVPC
jgi:transportin-3